MVASAKDYARIYKMFQSSIAEQYDCGRMCAPLNGGEPLCCSTQHAVPIVTKAELKTLQKQTDIWKKFKPYDKATRKIVDGLDSTCKAVECSIAPACQRDYRTLACRSFPFFPYFTKKQELVGLAYYWDFEDRCWVLSNLQVVERKFVQEFIAAYEYLFSKDEDELEAFLEQSSDMRKAFSRKNRTIPIIGRDGGYFKVLPKSRGRVVPAKLKDFHAHDPYTSDRAYRKAIKDEGGNPEGKTLDPDWSIKEWWNLENA